MKEIIPKKRYAKNTHSHDSAVFVFVFVFVAQQQRTVPELL